jgi:chromate transporter
MVTAPDTSDAAPRPTLPELALLFLKLGCTAFGGPAAHIAMMEEEVVQRRRWLSRAQFLDLLAACNLIPGPNSTEMAIHVGLLAGPAGFVVAGVCFILPAALLVTLIAWGYVTYGQLPELTGVLYGVKPVIVAVVLQALLKFGRDTLRTPLLAGVAVLGVALTLAGVHELLILLFCGLLLPVIRWTRRPGPPGGPAPALLVAVLGPAATAAGTPAVPVGLGALFLFFLKVGSVLFGSGYVLLAFLRADLVERYGWLKERELLDAVAVGQVTPGPVFTTATFIGYLVAGPAGAAVATAGIFLPAFFFVAISGPLVPRLRRSPTAGAFLDGVVAASLALMAVVTWDLARAAVIDRLTVALAIGSAILLERFRVNSAWLVLGGAAVGWVASPVR